MTTQFATTKRATPMRRTRNLTFQQHLIVKTLDGMGDKAYLNAIYRAVNKGREKLIDLGAVHIVLSRLRTDEVLETYEIESSDFDDGRKRKLVIYRLTDTGRRLYDATRESFHSA